MKNSIVIILLGLLLGFSSKVKTSLPYTNRFFDGDTVVLDTIFIVESTSFFYTCDDDVIVSDATIMLKPKEKINKRNYINYKCSQARFYMPYLGETSSSYYLYGIAFLKEPDFQYWDSIIREIDSSPSFYLSRDERYQLHEMRMKVKCIKVSDRFRQLDAINPKNRKIVECTSPEYLIIEVLK